MTNTIKRRVFTIDCTRGKIVVTRNDGRVLGRFSSETKALEACKQRAELDNAATVVVAGRYPKDTRPKGDTIAVIDVAT